MAGMFSDGHALPCLAFALVRGGLAASPLPWVAISEAEPPQGAVRSVVRGGEHLTGACRHSNCGSVMYSYSAADVVSEYTQDGRWFDPDWEDICEMYHAHGRPVGAQSGLAFLDVGANIGTFAIPMSQCLRHASSGAAGSVIAVEASPRHVDMLKANVNVNDASNILLFPYAVGDHTDHHVTLAVHPENNCITAAIPVPSFWETAEKLSAEMTTLDEIYRAYPDVMRRVLAMKLDVEGYEGRVVKGAHALLKEAPPCYLKMEVQEDWLKLAGTPAVDVLNKLRSYGFVSAWPGSIRIMHINNS